MNDDLANYPEGLTPPERRILDFVREGMLDAEIAVRLGVPIGELKDRLGRMERKLGVIDRAGLLGWQTTEGPVETPASRAEQPEVSNHAGATGRRFTRRRMLTAAGAGAALTIGAGVATLLAKRGGRNSRAGGSESPAAATLTPITAATPIARRGLEWIEPSPGALVRTRYTSADIVEPAAGLYFVSTNDGAIEGWRLVQRAGESAGPDGFRTGGAFSFLVATGDTPGEEPKPSAAPGTTGGIVGGTVRPVSRLPRSWFVNRASGLQATWPADRLFLTGVGERTILLEEVEPDGLPAIKHTGKFHLVDDELHLVRSFELPRVPGSSHFRAMFSPKGENVVVPGSDDGRLYHVSIDTGAVRPFFTPPQPPAGQRVIVYTPIPTSHFDRVLVSSVIGPMAREVGEREYSLAVVDWSTGASKPVDLETFDISPTGLQVQERYLRRPEVLREDSPTRGWPAVVVATAEGVPLFRVRSAVVRFGDGLPQRRWLDASRILVMLRQSGLDAGTQSYGYGFVEIAPGGSATISPLPPAPAGKHWYESPYFFAPTIPRTGTRYLNYGRTGLYDIDTGRWALRALASQEGPGHLDPWGTGDAEFVFSLPHYGHGGAGGALLLPPKIEFPPFDDSMRFIVARTGDCLNVRAAPAIDSQVMACLPDGAPLELAENVSENVVRSSDGELWVRVHAPSAGSGWVAARYLDWA